MPETKDRSLGEIEEHFRNGQGLRLNVIKVMMVMVMVMVTVGMVDLILIQPIYK